MFDFNTADGSDNPHVRGHEAGFSVFGLLETESVRVLIGTRKNRTLDANPYCLLFCSLFQL